MTFHFHVHLVIYLLVTHAHHACYPIKCPHVRPRMPGDTWVVQPRVWTVVRGWFMKGSLQVGSGERTTESMVTGAML